MRLAYCRFGPWFTLILPFGVAAFLVAACGALPSAVVYANPINIQVTIVTPFAHGGCGIPPTTVFDNSNPANPGFTLTLAPQCQGPDSGFGNITNTGVFSLTGLNGYQIQDFSASITCGVTGNDFISLSFNSLVLTCPSFSTPGTTGTVSGVLTFAPVLSTTETITLTESGVLGGTGTVVGFSNFVSLLAPPPSVPEPNSLLLLCTGLIGLAGMARSCLLRR